MIKKIVVVERLKLRKKPSYVSETFNHELSFGDVLIGKKIINHIDDFSYLEIDWQMQKAYVPLQYLIEENNSYSTIGERHLKQFPLNFVPKNLVQIPSIYTVNENVLYTTQSTLTQLIKLIDAAKKENIVINVINAYKGISDLAKTYAKEYEECFMQNIVDKPCQANYHLGTVLDITTTEINNRIHPLFFKTNAFKWLKSNVTKYSFQFTSSLKSFINKNNVWKPYQIQYIKEKLNDNNNVNDKIPSSFKFIQYKKTFFYYTAKNKLTNLKYLFIHDNEHTAKRVARYAVSYYGGTIFEIINANKRNLQISINDYLINYDPNRIFTTKGIYENIKWLNPECPEPIIQTAIKQINKIKNSFLKSLSLTKKDHLFSIHTNNKMTELSINYFVQNDLSDSFKVFINKNQNPKNFFYTLTINDFNFFKRNGFNVVLQKESLKIDDGSLSVIMSRKKMNYLTIEVQEGNYLIEKKMIDLAVKYSQRKSLIIPNSIIKNKINSNKIKKNIL